MDSLSGPSVCPWNGEDHGRGFPRGLPKLAQAAEAAAALGCTSCCTYVLPSTDLGAAHFMALATRRLRTCAQILGAYGIRLGLEFVGPHHLRTRWKHPFIWTIDETLDWIDAIGERNVGLLFDSYHWYTNGFFHDLSDKNSAQKKTALEEIKVNDRRETFDLRRVPFRVILCKLDEKRYEMVISNHHILYDGWSNGIILKEFFNTYRQLSTGDSIHTAGQT